MRGKFQDRRHAGRQLAARLRHYAGRPDVLVLGLAHGGVMVASEVARELNLPLDVFVVRKLGAPGHPEIPMGALTTGGVRVLDERTVQRLRVSGATVARVTSEEHEALERHEDAYRRRRPTPDVRGRTVVLVDDRLVAGAGIFPAVAALRQEEPAAIVVAAPVAAPDAVAAMRAIADDCVYVVLPEHLHDLSAWYADLSPVGDADVGALLEEAAWRQGTEGSEVPRAPVREHLAPPPASPPRGAPR